MKKHLMLYFTLFTFFFLFSFEFFYSDSDMASPTQSALSIIVHHSKSLNHTRYLMCLSFSPTRDEMRWESTRLVKTPGTVLPVTEAHRLSSAPTLLILSILLSASCFLFLGIFPNCGVFGTLRWAPHVFNEGHLKSAYIYIYINIGVCVCVWVCEGVVMVKRHGCHMSIPLVNKVCRTVKLHLQWWIGEISNTKLNGN